MQFSVRSTAGAWGPWLDAAAEEEDQPDAGSPRGGGDARLARRQPHLGRAGERDPVPHQRPGARPPCVVRPQPGAEDPAPRGRLGRLRRRSCRAARGGQTSRSARARRSTRRRSASRACTTRRARTTTRRPRRRRSCAAIEVYHVKSNGWNDIGYNFLVDRYGTVYEGRYGGIDRNVIGAYARGFNTGSIGVAVIGTFSTAAIPAAAETSLEKLLAWRLDLAHVDPVSTLDVRLGRQRALSGRRPRRPARRLRPPRHGPDDLPRRSPLREARHDRGEDAGDRAAEALRAEGDRRPRRPGAVPGARLLGARVEGDRHRPARPAARGRHGQGADGRLHLGRVARHRRRAHDWRIDVAGRHARVGHVREAGRRRRRPARDHRSRRRSGDDQPERRRPGRLDHDHLLDERTPRRSPRRCSMRPASSSRRSGRPASSPPASTRSPSTGSDSPTASTRSSSPRSTRRESPSRAS